MKTQSIKEQLAVYEKQKQDLTIQLHMLEGAIQALQVMLTVEEESDVSDV